MLYFQFNQVNVNALVDSVRAIVLDNHSCYIVSSLCVCCFRTRWLPYQNTLWPSDAMWRLRSGATLAQVMTCCLTAPSHHLNQCWLIISEVQWHSYHIQKRCLNHQPQKSIQKFHSISRWVNEIISKQITRPGCNNQHTYVFSDKFRTSLHTLILYLLSTTSYQRHVFL